ncbi:hypothetical protein A3Q29_17290 [Providencia stuartii]|uniref:Uncharacterized protein n=1 Tax=Providencia stuartii TaxID=588 RepID=A0A1S1HQ66_PROST|nr:hypothetical protein A3Q29_17290 [Providencia stuartii]
MLATRKNIIYLSGLSSGPVKMNELKKQKKPIPAIGVSVIFLVRAFCTSNSEIAIVIVKKVANI